MIPVGQLAISRNGRRAGNDVIAIEATIVADSAMPQNDGYRPVLAILASLTNNLRARQICECWRCLHLDTVVRPGR